MKFNSTLIKIFTIVALLTLPAVALAQFSAGGNYTGRGLFGSIFGCAAPANTGASGPGILCIIGNILNFILAIAFIIAVVFLVVGGFRYVVSGGNEDAIEKAKGTITNAIIGIVVIVLAYVILQLVLSLANTGNAGTTT